MSEHANFGISYYFHIITLVPKRKRPKPGRSSSHLRCVKATRLTSGELRRAEDLNWESEIGSLSQSLASHTLYLFFLLFLGSLPRSLCACSAVLRAPAARFSEMFTWSRSWTGRGAPNTCLRRTFLPPRNLNPLGFLFMIPKGMPYYMSRRMRGEGGGGEEVGVCVIAPNPPPRPAPSSSHWSASFLRQWTTPSQVIKTRFALEFKQDF